MGAATALFRPGRYGEALHPLERLIQQEPENAWALYHSACVLARLHQNDAAIARLAAAIAYGEEWQQMAATDSDFDGLRDTPRFQQLLALCCAVG